jgi:hypothetical protein
MAFQSGDLMVVNRSGTDYKALISDLLDVAEGQINDGKLTIKESQGTDGGDALEYEFTANQETDSQVVIGNGCFQLVDHEGNLLGDFFANQTQNEIFRLPAPPTVGSGNITIQPGDGLASSGDGSHNANQQDDTAQVLSVRTGSGLEINANGEVVVKPGAGIEIDLDGNVIIDPTFDLSNQVDKALGDLTDVDDSSASEGEVLVKLPDGSYGFVPAVDLPETFRPLGFANVGAPCPKDTPEPGDLYIHHDPDITRDGDDDFVIADASWVGIAGETIYEGEYVVYSTDNEWHRGGGLHDIEQVQADWAEEDTNSLAYIQNKPCVYECHNYIQHLDPLPD